MRSYQNKGGKQEGKERDKMPNFLFLAGMEMYSTSSGHDFRYLRAR